MGKRAHADLVGHSNQVQSAAKKARGPSALDQLSARADELIACLQSLKNSRNNGADEALKSRLSSLSRDLLPTFQSLAGCDTDESAVKPEMQPKVPLLTAWDPSEVAHELPPLPPVHDPALERASLTHPGRVQSRVDQHYEQLEWVGDAYIYLFSTVYIFRTFPHLKHGDMSQIREVLVRNATLRGYSIHYGLDRRAVFPEEYGLGGRQGGTNASSKERSKVLGDLFEAHVAAIILSDPIGGVAATASWLKALWSTTIPEQIRKRTWQDKAPPLVAPVVGATPVPSEKQHSQSQSSQEHMSVRARDRLQAEVSLSEPRVQVEYRSLDDEQSQKRDQLTNIKLFTQGAFLIGYGETVQLGTGTDKKKVVANEKAAMNALENKKLITMYRERKNVILEKKRAAEIDARGLGF